MSARVENPAKKSRWQSITGQVPLSLSDLPGLRMIGGRYVVQKRVPGSNSPARIWLTTPAEGDEACRDAYHDLVEPVQDGTVAQMCYSYLAEQETLLANNPTEALAQATIDSHRTRLAVRALHTNPRTQKPDVYGIIPKFGRLGITELTPAMIRQYLSDSRLLGRKVTANREKSLLSSVYEWAMANPDRYPALANDFANPAKGVKRAKETPSKKYAEDHELERFKGYCTEALAILIDGAWHTGMRFTDLAQLKDHHLKLIEVEEEDEETGETVLVEKMFIDWQESKTGKANLMELYPEGREVIETALAFRKRQNEALRHPRPESEYVFTTQKTRHGWTKNALGSSWQDAREAAAKAGWKVNFSFRVIRAKTATDSAENTIGHLKGSQLLENVYTRNRRRLKSLKREKDAPKKVTRATPPAAPADPLTIAIQALAAAGNVAGIQQLLAAQKQG